jgi:hypothetical protein
MDVKQMKAIGNFDVTGWEPTVLEEAGDGPGLTQVTIKKTFSGGELEGESVGQGLFCGMSDPSAGAGYVVSERFIGKVKGRSGSFVIQHGGLMGPSVAPTTFGNIVPGSGRGELVGIAGTVEINQGENGKHQMAMALTFPNSTKP